MWNFEKWELIRVDPPDPRPQRAIVFQVCELRLYRHVAEIARKYFTAGKRNGEITREPVAGIGGYI